MRAELMCIVYELIVLLLVKSISIYRFVENSLPIKLITNFNGYKKILLQNH